MSDTWNADFPSEWHSIRPWTPHLTLSVREITSVSATFILSSSLDDPHDPSLTTLGISVSDDEDDSSTDPDQVRRSNGESSSSSRSRRRAIISDALAKGLSVDVNGSPWQRVIIRVDDQVDEAVIIIYGLMPGRQYDIDLGLVQGGQSSSIRKQVTTEESELRADNDRDVEVAKLNGSTSSDSMSSSITSSVASESSSTVQPQSSTANSAPCSLEDRVRQLQQSLASLTSERETLTASLKNTRRESQKADSALRTEIDILKRASEKNASAEHRAKQKVLALQEAVKRAQTATKEIEELVRETESSLPGLRNEKDEKEAEYAKVKEEADQVKGEREKEQEQDRKRLDSMKGELTGLGNRLEKLNGKREKLETSIVPDLEEQLREIEREIEQVESAERQYTLQEEADIGMEESDNTFGEFSMDGSRDSSSHPFGGSQSSNRNRNHHPVPIGRPTTIPIHRPMHSSLSGSSQYQIASRTAYRSPIQQPHLHSHQQSLPANLRTPGYNQASGLFPHANSDTNPIGTVSPTLPAGVTATGTPSTLSSRAAPFEPTSATAQAIRGSLSLSTSRFTFPPIQRPGPLLTMSSHRSGTRFSAGQNTSTGERGGQS
ncbi:hypothetical protein SERLA73DRAFT_191010 [Serpula lacrymans var. lacrymans S7.3]|uniref:Uncharacterized protein n=1 Tax=Serpula lacrymans var. lacrymans (strain S7.3) TaxID=936435 RepID=F8QGT1_SERL3|nr:hypothetical protein SERLA73DRAFT_191010 [Serpula lacrymans var. lacrymans S7.3]